MQGIEAAVWKRIGHLRRAKETLVDAYRIRFATSAEMLKNAFVARTGDRRGFDDYLMTRLTGETRVVAISLPPNRSRGSRRNPSPTGIPTTESEPNFRRDFKKPNF